jgi:GNAT superfamily N-acetyltransferase
MPLARVVARVSPTLRDANGQAVGMLGFYEAAEDADAAGAVLRRAVSWLRDAGAGAIVGPMDGDTWHRYRFAVGPFIEPAFLMEPVNPAYYAGQWERAGFRPLETYYSSLVDDPAAAARGTARVAGRPARHGIRLRRLEPRRLREELETIHRLSCRIFAGNAFYTPISLEDFLSLYEGVGALLDPDFVQFARTMGGEEIGYVFALPDNVRAVAAMRGRTDLLARLRFLCLRGRTDTVNIKTLGVVPEHQRKGVAVMLMHAMYATAVGKGYRRARLCLIREGNPSGRMDGDAGRVFRRYRLYEWGGA